LEKIYCLFTNEEMNAVPTSGGNRDVFSYNSKSSPHYEYLISGTISHEKLKEDFPNGKTGRLNCYAEILKERKRGNIIFWHSAKNNLDISLPDNTVQRDIENIAYKLIDHGKKRNFLLKLIFEKTKKNGNPFKEFLLSRQDLAEIDIHDSSEIITWYRELENDGLISIESEGSHHFHLNRDPDDIVFEFMRFPYLRLTPKALTLMQNFFQNIYNKCFLAIAFTDPDGKPVNNDVRNAIREVLKSFDIELVVIDEKEHNDGIMDHIIAEINEAKFVIADLSYHKNGVYFEAGFAKGQGKQVIHTVNREHKKNIHFDVQHLNLIIWTNTDHLKEKLANRIRATMAVE
jgi:hypothetical protein